MFFIFIDSPSFAHLNRTQFKLLSSTEFYRDPLSFAEFHRSQTRSYELHRSQKRSVDLNQVPHSSFVLHRVLTSSIEMHLAPPSSVKFCGNLTRFAVILLVFSRSFKLCRSPSMSIELPSSANHRARRNVAELLVHQTCSIYFHWCSGKTLAIFTTRNLSDVSQ